MSDFFKEMEFVVKCSYNELTGVIPDEVIQPIVRCRDCKHFEEIEGMFKWCSFHNMDVKEHDFCSKGERRQND